MSLDVRQTLEGGDVWYEIIIYIETSLICIDNPYDRDIVWQI